MKKLTNLFSILTLVCAIVILPLASNANQFVFPTISSNNGGTLNASVIVKGIKITSDWGHGFNFELYLEVDNKINLPGEGHRNNTFWNYVVSVKNSNPSINVESFSKTFESVKLTDDIFYGFTPNCTYSKSGAAELGMVAGELYTDPSKLAFLGLTTASLFVNSGQFSGTYYGSAMLGSAPPVTVNPAPLPVTLSSFTAEATSLGSVLAWTTSFEKDNKAFVIEISGNTTTWAVIGQLSAKAEIGENDIENRYEFVDNKPLAGNNFYRLKMVDLSGEFEYSKIVRTYHKSLGQSTLNIHPNPATHVINIDGLNSTHAVSLINSFGQVILTSTTSTIDISNVANGTYWIKVVDANKELVSSHKIVKH